MQVKDVMIQVSGKRSRQKRRRNRLEFSKLLAVWAAGVATLVLVVSFALSAFDKQPVSDLAVAVFTACIGYLITYAGKSAYEKGSRNKYKLDEDGHPYEWEENHEENQLDTEADQP